MPFEKVETSVDFPSQERVILQFWADNGIFEKRKQLNAGKPKWSFLDGPITANNPMGVHHAWGRTYKDLYNRYFAMSGHELRYQNGFDCQGLWVEVEVEKSLGLKSKRDIENLVPGDPEASIDKFVRACKDRVNTFARVQTEQSVRLGYWMDWDRTDADWAKKPDERKSYFTMSEENNYTIWSFLKKCHGKGLISRGYDVMPWCGRCGVGISEQEMKEGYKLVEHRACFVKFPLKSRPGENLLVWTTTPWTLTSNVGAAVNPDLTYLQVKLKGEVYYVAKNAFKLNRMESSSEAGGDDDETEGGGKKTRPWLKEVPHLNSIEQHFKSKAGKGDSYEIVGEVRGADMLGWAYTGPFDDLPAQNHEYGFPEEVAKVTKQSGRWPATTAANAHRVISGGKDVTETEGTGIVHTAPGCGAIDYVWGKENGLPPVAPIGDDGVFVPGFGPLEGKNAADATTADAVFEQLKATDRLFVTERYVHRYPHCWRCKTELLYRLVDEWFINMGPKHTEEGFRGAIMKVVDRVTFLPESINGKARERDWLWNMGDWMISKKRFWGLALPIWVDETDPNDFEVIGSYAELKERAVEGWSEFEGHTPHRPWVDKVKIRSRKTNRLMSRISDVGNPWLDAGIVGFSTLKYNTDRAYWEKWYPADFVTESFPGQFRNWFYALLAMSTMMSDGQPPFKTLFGHGLVKDQYGNAMSKSSGNSIEFVAAADEGGEIKDPKGKPLPFNAIGADVMRWMYCRANPAANLNFGPEPANEVRSKVFFKLWNTYAMFCNYATGDGFDPAAPAVPVAERQDVDRWLLSNLELLVKEAREAYESYNVMAFALACEEFIESDLSNWYVRRNKDRLHSKNAELDATGRKDKNAAYQTLYTTLTTLCKLMAPCVPFVTEAMWKNLRLPTDPESVHLCAFPHADETLVDAPLSEDMKAVQRVISLGLSARQAAKLNVRQPLAELVASPGSDADRRAVARFPDLIIDELNVKAVRLHDAAAGPLLTASARLNKKSAGGKLGAKLKEAEEALAAADAADLAARLLRGPVEVTGVALDKADFAIEFAAHAGWCGVADQGTQVAISTTITEALKLEGLARDVVRQVQNARKDAKLDLLDKIALHLGTEAPELAKAIGTHRDTIGTAVQATQWSDAPLTGAGAHTATVKIDGHPLAIALQKA
ncbi:class I tRNA ligase family protein [Frigoriglobus tundricola]|uniref:isoleucine--tRNA ligase n=1 Tax=Frigoriglobus tundricola TaxID=2774151 RepID=A0A6M5YP00_9BACT|nr:class I tRNA ligase family protein [Frigoriglobus tundricola]QJW95698.1 Isoleucyl-tRNA synthetase [Frigoriglobus tundricola]